MLKLKFRPAARGPLPVCSHDAITARTRHLPLDKFPLWYNTVNIAIRGFNKLKYQAKHTLRATDGTMKQSAGKVLVATAISSQKSAAPPDARAYMSVVDCPAFLQAVADGNANAVEEFHNDGVGKLNKVSFCFSLESSTVQCTVLVLFNS